MRYLNTRVCNAGLLAIEVLRELERRLLRMLAREIEDDSESEDDEHDDSRRDDAWPPTARVWRMRRVRRVWWVEVRSEGDWDLVISRGFVEAFRVRGFFFRVFAIGTDGVGMVTAVAARRVSSLVADGAYCCCRLYNQAMAVLVLPVPI